MKADIIIRADASVILGIGHVMRCLTLADALSAQGLDVRFACSPETPAIAPLLAQSAYVQMLVPEPCRLLIVDHYGLDADFERQARHYADRIMVIDDLPTRHHDCDVLLDQTFQRHPDQWRPWLPDHAQVLAGTQYLLLRPEFTTPPPPPRRHLRHVLVTLGGTDPTNITSLVLDGLALSGLDMSVDVVMGTQSPHLAAITQRLALRPNYHLHVNATHMAALMDQADLAIGAGGGTAWERCSRQLPSILLEIADNQHDVIQSLVTAQAGLACRLDAVDLSARLQHLALHPDQLETLSRHCGQICPPHGTSLVTQAVLDLLRESP